MHLTWMLRSFIMGMALLGLSYWLVQNAGIQYLASLTSGTLLFFLLAYVVWCLLHRNRHSQQTPDGTSRMETGNISPIAGVTEPLTPTPPPPFDQHQAYKFITTASPRDPSPPPSYDEAIRAMMVMAASTPVSLDPVPEPSPEHQSANVAASIPASLTPRPYPSTRIESSPSALSQQPALTPGQESAPVTKTLSALTQPSASTLVHPTQPTLTPQLSTALTQISSSAASSTPSQQMEEVS